MKKALLLLALLLPSVAAAQLQILEDEATAALRRLPILMVDATDGETEETGLTVSCTLSKAGAAFGAGGGSVTEVGNGEYYYAASAGDVDTPGYLSYRCTATGADNFHGMAQVLEIHDGTATAGSASTITLASGSSSTNDLYNGRYITVDQGTGAGQTRCITDYVGSTLVATVSPSWTTAPASGSEYVFGESCQVDTIRIEGTDATDQLGSSTSGLSCSTLNACTFPASPTPGTWGGDILRLRR